jgi:hypothetical protein
MPLHVKTVGNQPFSSNLTVYTSSQNPDMYLFLLSNYIFYLTFQMRCLQLFSDESTLLKIGNRVGKLGEVVWFNQVGNLL